MSFKAPAQFRDLALQRDPSDSTKWLGRTWRVPIRVDGIPAILTDSTITVVVDDDEAREVSLAVDASLSADGIFLVTITPEQILTLGRYSTWKLYESPRWGEIVVQGRLVKER